MAGFDVPATVTIERGNRRLRCKVREWGPDAVQCEPLRASPESLAFLIPRSVVSIAWSTDTSLMTVPGAIQGRPDGGVVTIAFSGPVTTVQRRDRIRARCVFPCELAVADPDEGVRFIPGETIDLSSTGVGLRASVFAEVDTSVAVAIYPTGDELPLLAGRIVSVVEDTGRVGVAFRSAYPGDLDKVATLVARLLANRVTH